MREWKTLLAAAAGVALGFPASAHAAEGVAAEQGDADLALVSEFLLPQKMTLSMGMESCSAGFANAYAKNAALAELETQLPGLRDRMVAGASTYCMEKLPGTVAAMHDQVRRETAVRFSRPERARLAPLLREAVEQANAIEFTYRPGENARQVFRRKEAASAADADGFEKRLATWGAMAENRATMAKLAAFQTELANGMSGQNGAVVQVLVEAKGAAHVAANALAKERGLSPPYPNK